MIHPLDIPGMGDEETWGPCRNHPNDPRTPDAEDIEEEDDEIRDS